MSLEDLRKVVCQPGQLAPTSGVYAAKHLNEHRSPHEVIVIRGEEFPPCRTCRSSVRFQLTREIDHVHHDWDLAGLMETSFSAQPPDFDSVRTFRRIAIDLPVTIEFRQVKKPVYLRGHTINLSEGGMGVVIGERIAEEKRNLTIRLPGIDSRREILVNARLRYRKGMHHGFEFTRVSSTDRDAIRELCARAVS